MTAKVEHWTPEQITAFKAEHLANKIVSEWVVKDGGIIEGFYKTEVGAKQAAFELDRDEKIAEHFQDWLDATAAEFKVGIEHVKEIVEAQV